MRLAQSDSNTRKRARPEVPSARNFPLQSRTRAGPSAFPLISGGTAFVRLAGCAALACLLLAGRAPLAVAQTAPPPPGAMKPLGGERYQIGKIIVDRKERRMTLPARVHVVDRPLEYLLTTTGGMKEYESLFEADISGTEFNLACILLGLERDKSQEPYLQFSPKPLAGPRVEITVAGKDGDRAVRWNASEVMFDAGQKAPEPVEWVYVGSQKNWQDDRYAADVTGTLIGFVHDPNTVIESAMGLGIGAYGSVNGNAALLPSVGAEVEVSITVPSAGADRK